MTTSKRAKREAEAKQNREALDRIAAERLARGVCRHCGGPVPCWSPYGDAEVGVRHSENRKGSR